MFCFWLLLAGIVMCGVAKISKSSSRKE
jgi:hypothetical protein